MELYGRLYVWRSYRALIQSILMAGRAYVHTWVISPGQIGARLYSCVESLRVRRVPMPSSRT